MNLDNIIDFLEENFYVIIYIIAFIGGFILLGVMHEQVHIEIFKSHGIDSHAEYFSHFPDFVTITDPKPGDVCNNTCILSHDLNEAIGYQLTPLYILIGFGFLIIIIQNRKKR